MVSEELRLLYVAVTRAKERLILCVAEKNLGKKLAAVSALYAGDPTGEKLPPVSAGRCQSYADWILAAFIRHPDMQELRTQYGIEDPGIRPAAFPLRVLCPSGAETLPPAAAEAPAAPQPEMVSALRQRFDWQYPHAALTKIPSKLSVTRLTHPTRKMRLSTPQFLSNGSGILLSEECAGDETLLEKRASEGSGAPSAFTPAQQGTIFHRALQFADYQNGAADPDGELNRLIDRQYLTPAEAETIDRKAFAAFFRSELMARMLRADTLLREYKFFDTIPASEAGYPEGSSREILLQGIADCIFIEQGRIWLVDYKTDQVGSMQILVERYASQLALYRRAILRQPRFAGLTFGGSCIYSTRLGRYTILDGQASAPQTPSD
jgi:ATP-dependent helicase/nuclease subunit A